MLDKRRQSIRMVSEPEGWEPRIGGFAHEHVVATKN